MAKFSPKRRFSVGLSLNSRSVEGRGKPPWRRSSRTGIPVFARGGVTRGPAIILRRPPGELDERMPRRVRGVATQVVDPPLPFHGVRETHLSAAVDAGPQEVHRQRLVGG